MDFSKLLQQYESESSRPQASRGQNRAGDERKADPTEHREKRARRAYVPTVRESPRPSKSSLRTLVIVCAGPKSIHDEWLTEEDLAEGVRLGVMWYGSEEPEERFTKVADKVMKRKGLKWPLIRAALKELYPNWREDFDYIWLPDDDLKFIRGKPQNLARVMADFNLDLAQPCLSDMNITSASFRPLVLKSQNPRALFHRTNFVEIMCPMLSVSALEKVFATFDDDRCKCGWGLDSVWPSMLSPKGVAIVDSVEVEHTRAPQAFNTSESYDGIDPRKEELELLTRYRVAPYSKRVLEIVELL